MTMKRREKKLEEHTKIQDDREQYFEDLESDMDKKWKELEKSRYEHEQAQGKHEREWSDVKHMMERSRAGSTRCEGTRRSRRGSKLVCGR